MLHPQLISTPEDCAARKRYGKFLPEHLRPANFSCRLYTTRGHFVSAEGLDGACRIPFEVVATFSFIFFFFTEIAIGARFRVRRWRRYRGVRFNATLL